MMRFRKALAVVGCSLFLTTGLAASPAYAYEERTAGAYSCALGKVVRMSSYVTYGAPGGTSRAHTTKYGSSGNTVSRSYSGIGSFTSYHTNVVTQSIWGTNATFGYYGRGCT